MGDIICTIPAALELKKRHAEAEFIYNCDPDFAIIPRMAGVTERCTHCREIGVVGHWYGFLLGGFYDFAHGDDFPQTSAQKPMFQEFCEQFGVEVAASHPTLTVPPEIVRKVKGLLESRGAGGENLILFHVGPTWPVKEWPAASWAKLAEGLRRHGFRNLIQIGVGGYLRSQRTQPQHSLKSSVDLGPVTVPEIPHATSMVGALSLEESVAAISLARLFVGIDSGLLHVAACLRTPAVGIFGPTAPDRFYAEEYRADFVASRVTCAGCHHRVPRLHWITGCPHDIQCLRDLPAEVVVEACARKLAADARPGMMPCES